MNKYFKISLFLLATAIVNWSCSKEEVPEEVHPKEVITTMKVVLTPKTGGSAVTLQSRDLDGDGPKAPVITGGTLDVNKAYDGVITLLNETESPAEDITKEVKEEAEEHQMFYKATGRISATFAYAGTNDKNGRPIGVKFTLTTGSSIGTGNFVFTLRHEPNKAASGVSTGDITNAGGETDIEVTFPITLQ